MNQLMCLEELWKQINILGVLRHNIADAGLGETYSETSGTLYLEIMLLKCFSSLFMLIVQHACKYKHT